MRVIRLFSVVAVLLVAQLSYAHHPFDAEFDRTKPVTLTGTVTKVDWVMPHVTLQVDVKEGSNAGQWTVELGAPERLTKEGWTQTSLKNGEQVTVEGWAAKSGTKRANAKSVTMPGGRVVSAASSFSDAPTQLAADRTELPRTASSLPLIGLAGLLALASGLMLRIR